MTFLQNVNKYSHGAEFQKQGGFTLIEMVVAIVLLGVLVPFVFGIFGQVSIFAARGNVVEQAFLHAESKMEEITGIKEINWDWADDPDQFEVDEDLPDNYHRVVTVTGFSGWGDEGIDGWDVDVVVTHPMLPNGVALSMRLTQYEDPH